MNTKNLVNFIFEIGQLKRQYHSGFQLAGIKNTDTVAEHVMRAAQIGYILAVMEGDANPEKVATMIIIHDNGEARIGDQNKVAARYFDNKQAERDAFFDQVKNLGGQIEKKWKKYFSEFEGGATKEGIIAKDADWLELAFQAKEYLDLGNQSVQDWINNIGKSMRTKSAKTIIKEMKQTKFTDWWKGLKKFSPDELYK